MPQNSFTKAALHSDALSLGPHWVYNQSKLKRVYPDGVRTVTDPASDYHPNRKAGEYTHYGDQTKLLADSIAARGGFNLGHWQEDWVKGMTGYDGYVDNATKVTLASNGNSPSDSNDLAGASRLAPILDLDLSPEAAVQAAREQTALTHGDPGVADAAEFFVRSVFHLKDGQDFSSAFDLAAAEGSYAGLDVVGSLKAAREADPGDFLGVSSRLGLTCHLPEAFPLTLYFALRPGANFAEAISDNGLAGGDTSARAMLLAVLFEARDGDGDHSESTGEEISVEAGANNIVIETAGGRLAGVLEMPAETPRGFALFAHCFTCGKDFVPEKRVAQGLAERGIATLRIDFAGIGKSEGHFRDSSFVTNLEDLREAAAWMTGHFSSPGLLIGHSLGGTAVLAAAAVLEGVKAVATIGAPADPAHVTHLFSNHLDEIREKGEAEVDLAGRPFVIGKRFLEDLDDYCHREALEKLRGIDFLIMHAPGDQTVPIANAGEIYTALRHPKSFLSLAHADHLLTSKEDAEYVAAMIATWAQRALA